MCVVVGFAVQVLSLQTSLLVYIQFGTLFLSGTDRSTATPVDDMQYENNFTGSGSGAEKDDLTTAFYMFSYWVSIIVVVIIALYANVGFIL